jgi:putative sigma-54 modulation protein
MQIKISSKHMNITPAIEQYVERKVERLRRFFDRILMIEVVIDKSRKGYTVEIITDVEHHEPFVATCLDTDLYACVDLGLDRASRQLKDHKSRLRDNHHTTPTSAAPKRTASGRAVVRRATRTRTRRATTKRS